MCSIMSFMYVLKLICMMNVCSTCVHPVLLQHEFSVFYLLRNAWTFYWVTHSTTTNNPLNAPPSLPY